MGFLLCSKKESFGYPESEGHTSGLLFDLSLFSSYPWIAAPFYLFSRLFRQGSFLNDNHDSTAAAAAAAAAAQLPKFNARHAGALAPAAERRVYQPERERDRKTVNKPNLLFPFMNCY
jgi:hypothetical protein